MHAEFICTKNLPLLPPKHDQGLRRVYSDVPTETNKIIEEFNLNSSKNEAQKVECECCGMSEECTPTYISRIKNYFYGKWVCGLCSEAVKEQMKRAPELAKEEALENHLNLCKHFNGTTRLNPKLSLAGAMRDIARKSSQKRSMTCGSKIARTVSCGPRLNVNMRGSSMK